MSTPYTLEMMAMFILIPITSMYVHTTTKANILRSNSFQLLCIILKIITNNETTTKSTPTYIAVHEHFHGNPPTKYTMQHRFKMPQRIVRTSVAVCRDEFRFVSGIRTVQISRRLEMFRRCTCVLCLTAEDRASYARPTILFGMRNFVPLKIYHFAMAFVVIFFCSDYFVVDAFEGVYDGGRIFSCTM